MVGCNSIRVGFRCSLLAGLISGCALIGDGSSSIFVSPGKYDYHNCEQLAEAGKKLRERERELTELMERAGQGPVGEAVGAVAYRNELMQTRGQLRQIAEAGERKSCVAQGKWKSDRALW